MARPCLLPALVSVLLATVLIAAAPLEDARDRQDQAALKQLVEQAAAAAQKKPQDGAAQHRLAVARSYLAEVAIELRDKEQSRTVAEQGIEAARRAVELQPAVAEHHRVLGTLCGQAVSANVLAGLRHGRCAKESIDKAIELDPRSAIAYVGRGVGSYYLPPAFGGGVEPALRDLNKALQLDPRSAEAYLWKGVVLRKANRQAEARQAFTRSLELNPRRVWARQQLEKTPAP